MKESDNRKTALVAGAGALLCLLDAGVGTPLLFRAPFGAEGGTGEAAFLLPSLFHVLATSVLFLALPRASSARPQAPDAGSRIASPSSI